MEELHRRFEEAFADGELLRAVTTAKEGSPAYEETAGFLDHMQMKRTLMKTMFGKTIQHSLKSLLI